MRIQRIIILSVLSILSFGAFSQDCTVYFPDEIGTVREMTLFDNKDNITGKIRQEIIDKEEPGGDINLTVRTVIFDEEENEISGSEIEMGCSDGVFKIDMKNYLGEILQAYDEMEVELQGEKLFIPERISVGDELPDGNIHITVRSSGIAMVNMDVSIVNRKVEAIEDVKTEAGTFECYKISYDNISKTRMISVQTSSVEWISEGVGIVRSENYNKRGKLSSYSVLTKLNR